MRTLLALVAWLPACASFRTVTPHDAARARAAQELPGPWLRYRLTVQVEAPGLAGIYDGVMIAASNGDDALRLQLFPEVGGKVLDLVATSRRISGAIPQAAIDYVCEPPATFPRDPHLLLFLGAALLEQHAPLRRERLLAARDAGSDLELKVAPAFAGIEVATTLCAGRVTRRRFALGYVEWEWQPGRIRGPGFDVRIRIHERTELPAAPPGVFGAVPVGLLFHQDPKPPDKWPEAHRLLKKLGERHGKAGHLIADYVQERTSALLVKPLVSKGELYFRTEPGCLVFRVHEPRVAIVRLDEKTYEVHRPKLKRLERYILPSSELPRALFQALSPRLAELDKAFEIKSFEKAGKAGDLRRITLHPRAASARKFMRGFAVTVEAATAALRAVTYTDPQGDRVTVRFRSIDLSSKPAPERFELRVPHGTRTLVHRPKRKKTK